MKYFFLILICLASVLVVSCSGSNKEKQDKQESSQRDSLATVGPERMQVSNVKEEFEYKGKEYQSVVSRFPDEALPVVVDEQGEKYYDNRITLRLYCAGKQIVDKSFTKESFASLVDADFRAHAILEGLVYDKTTPQGIVYAASVCYPQSDLFVPIRLTVTSDGTISMAKEETMEDYQEQEH